MEGRVATTRGIYYNTFFVKRFSKKATLKYSERLLASIEMVFRKEYYLSKREWEKSKFKNLMYHKKSSDQ